MAAPEAGTAEIRFGDGKRRSALLGHLLLAGNRHRLALTGTGVRVGPLTTHRQTFAMAQAAVAAQIHQALDVHRDFTPQIALDPVFPVYQLADVEDLLIGELVHPAIVGDAQLLADLGGLGRANAIDIAQPDQHALVGRDIHAGNTRHARLSCRSAVCQAINVPFLGAGKRASDANPLKKGGTSERGIIVPPA